MKTIVLVALLAAVGCSKKTSDCDAAISKGMDNFASSIKTDAPNAQAQETRLTVISKLRVTLTQRCNEDKWPAEVVSCFTTVSRKKDMQACQAKQGEAQRTKLLTEIRQVMMGSLGSRMPSGTAGHPTMLAGSGDPGGTPAAPSGTPAMAGSPSPASGSPAAGGTPAPAAGGAPAFTPSGAAADGSGSR